MLRRFRDQLLPTLWESLFAPTTSVFKLLRLVTDERIPGTLNSGHAFTRTIAQALIFIAAVSVDPLTLMLLIVASPQLSVRRIDDSSVGSLPALPDSREPARHEPNRRLSHS